MIQTKSGFKIKSLLFIFVFITQMLSFKYAFAARNFGDDCLNASAVGAMAYEIGICRPAAVAVEITNPYDFAKQAEVTCEISDLSDNSVLYTKTCKYAISPNTKILRIIQTDYAAYGTFNISVTAKCNDISVSKSTVYSNVVPTNEKADFMGFSTHFAFQNREKPSMSFPQIDASGVGWIRDEFYWRSGDTSSGYKVPDYVREYIQYAKDNNLKILMVLDDANSILPRTDAEVEKFAKFCGFAAGEFKDDVDAFEIWNEPNLSRIGDNGATGEQYTKILKAAYSAVKAANPKATVVGGALTAMNYPTTDAGISGICKTGEEFLTEMMTAGAAEYMDAFSFHPYTFGVYYYPDETNKMTLMQNVNKVKSILGSNVPIWFSECGYSNNTFLTEADQAIALTRIAAQVKYEPQVERMIVYNYREKGTDVNDAEHNWGIVGIDHTPKQAYAAIANINALLGSSEPFYKFDNSGAKFKAYGFNGTDGKKVYAIWAHRNRMEYNSPSTAVLTAVSNSGAATATQDSISIGVPDDMELTLSDMYGNTLKTLNVGESYTVTYEPVYAILHYKNRTVKTDGNTVRVYGVTKPNRDVTMRVYESISVFGKTEYIGQKKSDAYGIYSFEFETDETKVYTMLINDSSSAFESGLGSGGDEFEIACTFYDTSGNEIKEKKDLYNADKIKIRTEITPKNGSSTAPELYGGVYVGDRLCCSNVAEPRFGADGKYTAETTLDIIGESNKIRLMFWQSDMRPVRESLSIEK